MKIDRENGLPRYAAIIESENDFQSWCIDAARTLGWRCAHFRSVRVQRKDGSVYYQTPVQADGSGYPDLCLVKDKRLIYAEVKSEKGKPTEEQLDWLEALGKAGAEIYIWRPSMREEILERLRGRE